MTYAKSCVVKLTVKQKNITDLTEDNFSLNYITDLLK